MVVFLLEDIDSTRSKTCIQETIERALVININRKTLLDKKKSFA